ncbi:MucBP domain-containing protein [Lactiplantibacillus sp. WILCCON 0030]|uniref:MucBP domain-containing protein n=1 Tax=Lactiplantibacillus brownii TaxID=3069269 RepID=A0ABU1ABS0_9LACO|nr:MucBP domain-containing protein [Lactiplantibacillus brownii]MDQ7938365.1 MucBP domain-containing protein [Lactiplantibacillus brownii]
MSNQKEHFRMYKKGKKWLFAGVVTSVMALGAWQDQVAQADTNASGSTAESQSATTTTTTTEKQVTLRHEATVTNQQPATESTTKTPTTAPVVKPESSVKPTDTTETNPKPTTDTSIKTTNASETKPAEVTSTTDDQHHATSDQSATTKVPETTATKATENTKPDTIETKPTTVAETKTDVTASSQLQASTPKLAVQSRITTRADENINDWMPNKTVQQMVLDRLNSDNHGKTWTSAAEITKQDMLLLTELSIQSYSTYIDGKSSFSLAGLEYATNLTNLDLLNSLNTPNPHFRGDITDIKPLAALTNLTTLQLSGQRVSDITPIAGLKKLVDLNLGHDMIADFSTLDAAQYTKYFYIAGQAVYGSVVRVPQTGKYTLVNPIKLPKGVALTLQPSAGRVVVDIPGDLPTASGWFFYNGATNTMNGNNIDYQVTQNQIMPGPTTSPYPNVAVNQNPYTYYLISIFYDSDNIETIDIFTPYIIAADAAAVTVKYVDANNQPLADETTLSGLIGDTYQATAKTIPGYRLKAEPTNATGTFSDTAQTVTFVYEEATSTVTVHYQDQNGQPIKADTQTTGQIGSDYQFEAPKILGYKYQTTNGNATGTYTEEPIEITFIYDEVHSTITVHHHDRNGNLLREDTQTTGRVGTDYKLDAPDILGYKYSDIIGSATGTFTEEPFEVTFIYDEVNSTVTAHYQDKNGKQLKADTQISGRVGTDYQLDVPEILGYKYNHTIGNATGTYTEEPLEVTFIYDEVNSTVTAHYQDQNGKQLKADTQISGQVGSSYALDAPEILGYKYNHTIGNAAGTYTEEPLEVTFIYDEVNSTVTAHYQDKNGKQLKPDTQISGRVGTDYQLDAPEILGYKYNNTVGNATGTYTEEPLEVTFIYDEVNSTVTAHYQDQNGKQLKADTQITGQVGTDYQLDAPEILGYKYNHTNGNATGTYTEEPLEVTFIYDEVNSTVTAHYQDQNGKQLKADTQITGQVGSNYSLTAPEIAGYSYHSTVGSASGQFDTSDSVVTFIYRQTVTPPVTPDMTGRVIVKHMTADGVSIAPNVVLTGKVGTPYQTFALNNSAYHLIKAPANATGIFTKDDLEISYIYEAVTTSDDKIMPEQPSEQPEPEPTRPTVTIPTDNTVKATTVSTNKLKPLVPLATKSTAQTLPQTNERRGTAMLGLTLLGSLVALATAFRRRKN